MVGFVGVDELRYRWRLNIEQLIDLSYHKVVRFCDERNRSASRRFIIFFSLESMMRIRIATFGSNASLQCTSTRFVNAHELVALNLASTG